MYGAAKVSVWWDIENCPVPKTCNFNSVARNITSALVNLSYQGPISISAYGDTNRIPNLIQHALSSTGVSLNHVPAGAKDASDKKILVDMLFWAVDNPAPANYLLISGDSDFSNALHQLAMRRYNILLAHPHQTSPASLLAAAKVVWLWSTLSAGGPPHHIAPSDSSVKLPEPIQFKPKPKPKPKYSWRTANASRTPTSSPIQPPQNKNTLTDAPNVESPLPKPLFKAPHEFFSANDPIAPSYTPNLPSNQESSKRTAEGIPHDSSHHSPLRQNQSLSGPILMNMPKRNVNEYTDNNVVNAAPIVHQETGEDSGSNTGHGPPPGGYENLNRRQTLIDVILVTLNALKVEMVVSTERNITDCIRYGDSGYRTIDVREALDFAIEEGKVERRTLGALHLYVGRNEELWKFVNHIGGDPNDFPETTWDRIKQFLISSSGRSLILGSRCRYEASLILRRSCLAELGLGDVLKILEMIITVKEWIKVNHQSGWLPITIRLMETGGDR